MMTFVCARSYTVARDVAETDRGMRRNEWTYLPATLPDVARVLNGRTHGEVLIVEPVGPGVVDAVHAWRRRVAAMRRAPATAGPPD